MSIKREDLTPDWVERRFSHMRETGNFEPLSHEERAASLDRMLAAVSAGEDVWLFGYGSLMWNPTVYFEEQREGLIYGYRRRFCFWVMSGRGSPEMPGLMLGLERGGSCSGVAFRIRGREVANELEILWRREMISGVYFPRWVTVHSPKGKIRAITFVVDQQHKQYARDLTHEKAALHLAKAKGWLGSGRKYLENTIASLTELGLSDSYLNRLHNLVQSQDPT